MSPAFHAGLKSGDHLLEINGLALKSEQQYASAVDQSPDRMELKVYDPDKRISSNTTAFLNP